MCAGRMRASTALPWIAFGSLAAAAAPLGTAFTYQRHLLENGSAANGTYDVQFTLYDAASEGGVSAGPYCGDHVAVVDGRFTVLVDFSTGAFTGEQRWLSVGVRSDSVDGNCAGGDYAALERGGPGTQR